MDWFLFDRDLCHEEVKHSVQIELLKLNTQKIEQRHWRHSSAFIVNFEHIQHLLFLVILLLNLNKSIFAGKRNSWSC